MKPCKRGHTGGRYKCRNCIECTKAWNATPEQKAYMKAWWNSPSGRTRAPLYSIRGHNKQADARDDALEAQLTLTKEETK